MEIIFQYLNNSIFGLLALLLFSYFILKKKVKASKRREAPEAAGGWPIIGHLRLLGGSKLPHITLGAMADKYGPIFSIRIGVHKNVVISSWEVAKECYTVHDSIVSSRPKSLGGKHLGYNYANFGFRAYDSFHCKIRKIIASELLSNRRLELQRHIQVSEVKRSVKELYNLWTKREEGSDQITVELDQWIGNVNLNVVMMMVCGKRVSGNSSGSGSGDEKDMRRCREAIRDFFVFSGKFMMGDAIPFLGWLDFGGYEKAMKKTAKELDGLVEEWLEEHRRKRDSGALVDGDRDFMDVMLSILEGMDLDGYDADTVNKATCLSIIQGGTDTISNTLIWALSLLLNNEEELKKAKEELETHVGNKRMVEASDISKLEYLQAIMKETLRLYPTGPLGGIREFTQDCTLGGYDIAAGTWLIVNLWKIQTDPRVWEEPLEFKPERFLSTSHREVEWKGKSFEFIPFGGGRRACPGMGLAVQMTGLVLASLIHSLEIKTSCFNKQQVDMTAAISGLSLHRATPLQVMIKPRLLPNAYYDA